MHRRIAVALGVLALAALTACSTPASDPEPPAQNPTTQPAEEQPDAEAFTAALEGIDPALAADPEEALKAARNVCTYVGAGESEGGQLKAVKDRFEGVSDADAEKVLAAIKQHVC